MSLYIDLKYIGFIAPKLDSFKKTRDYLYNFRCPICGDSQSKKNKARGYFFKIRNDMMMKCHNCGASMHFGTFLKQFDPFNYQQYVLERYRDGENGRKPHKEPEFKFDFKPQMPEKKEESLLDHVLDRLDSLPSTNEAVTFCLERKIPEKQFSKLYFIDDIRRIGELSEKYKDRVQTDEPRLVLPFFDWNKQLTGVTCRGLRGEALRYITVKVKEDFPLVFGLDTVDKTKHIYVTEGPIDSLFLPNAIAVAGISFDKILQLGLDKSNMTVILDNQPRNKEVCQMYDKFIKMDYNVFVWPQNIEEKDVNDLILSGKSEKKVKQLIDENTSNGLTAKMKFVSWKRC
jgi:transcription elongation factor Elf1